MVGEPLPDQPVRRGVGVQLVGKRNLGGVALAVELPADEVGEVRVGRSPLRGV